MKCTCTDIVQFVNKPITQQRKTLRTEVSNGGKVGLMSHNIIISRGDIAIGQQCEQISI